MNVVKCRAFVLMVCVSITLGVSTVNVPQASVTMTWCSLVKTLMNAAVGVVCVREMQTASTVRAVTSVNVLMGISSHLMEPALIVMSVWSHLVCVVMETV